MNPLPKEHRVAIFLGCLVMLAALGWVDYITGRELGFFVFYSAPVGIAAFYVGRWPAIFVSLAASITWWLADREGSERYSSQFYFYWNEAVRFGCFVVNAVSISKIKSMVVARRKADVELARTRDEVRQLAATTTKCPACQQPLPNSVAAPVRTTYADSLCEDCRTRRAHGADAPRNSSP